ncbi:MAG: hypothetical protein ACK5MD_06935 [Flavobacteriales bacterium]
MLKFFKIIQILLLTLSLTNCYAQNKVESSNYKIIEKLNFPFGTLVRLTIEVIDGKNLRLKALQSEYLIKIIEVNDVKIESPLIIEFIDKTGEFPENNFKLYKLLYGNEMGSLSSDMIKKMNKSYVGKKFSVLAYESGKFTGNPNKSDYVKDTISSFELIRQDTNFLFKNFIIITSKLNE